VADSEPPLRAAQYFFIRSPTALRWAADMVRRRRGLAGVAESLSVST
jgi:hypothetical protein